MFLPPAWSTRLFVFYAVTFTKSLQVAETPQLEPVQYFGPIYAIALARGDTADEYTVSVLYVTLYIEKNNT